MSANTENLLYVCVLEKTKLYNKTTKALATKHVEFLRDLDDNGKLALCGISKGYPGVAGMIILKAENLEEAKEICRVEPLTEAGHTVTKVSTLQVADRENNYLL
jgi:uncharacterized protein YciI